MSTRIWLAIAVFAVLVLDYTVVLRAEIFEEMRQGRSLLEAIVEGNTTLALLGIFASVVGVALILYLLFGPMASKKEPGGRADGR